MNNSLFSRRQKCLLFLVNILISAYILLNTSAWGLDVQDVFRPYSSLLLLNIFSLWLIFIKRPQLKVWLFLSCLVFMLFNTHVQLNALFGQIDESRAVNGDQDILFENLESYSYWIKNEVTYRIFKIFSLDLIALFAYLAGLKTINGLKE